RAVPPVVPAGARQGPVLLTRVPVGAPYDGRPSPPPALRLPRPPVGRAAARGCRRARRGCDGAALSAGECGMSVAQTRYMPHNSKNATRWSGWRPVTEPSGQLGLNAGWYLAGHSSHSLGFRVNPRCAYATASSLLPLQGRRPGAPRQAARLDRAPATAGLPRAHSRLAEPLSPYPRQRGVPAHAPGAGRGWHRHRNPAGWARPADLRGVAARAEGGGMSGYTIAAIPTIYAGRRYRSRLEARWAAFFDQLGWRHEYEPYDLGRWSPDFLLPGFGLLVEVKPLSGFDVATWNKMASACNEHNITGAANGILLVGLCPVPVPKQSGDIIQLGWVGCGST